MAEVGYGSLAIIPSFKGFGDALDKGAAPTLTRAGASGGVRFGDAAGKSAGKRFGSIFKSAAKGALIGAVGLGAAATAFGADAVGAASDLAESANKLDQVFGNAAGRITRFSDKAGKALGQTDLQARNAAATFGIFGKAAELSDKKNAKFSLRMTRLASDLASFHNTSPEDAIEALGSALRGEAEPMRKYGVLMDDAALKAEAMSMGIMKPVKDAAKIKATQVRIIDLQKQYNEAIKEHGKDSLEAAKAEASLGTARASLDKAIAGKIPQLTQQQKVLAASSLVFKQTADAQGDFARTSDGLANQQRILKARFEDTKAEIGTALLPIVTDAVTFLNDKGVPAFEKFSGWFTSKGVPAIKDFADEVRPLAKSALPAMGDALTITRDALKDAAPYAKKMIDAFNAMPDWAKTAIVGGGISLGIGKKLGLVGGKGGGLTGGLTQSIFSAFTKKPIPVIVVNQGGDMMTKGGWLAAAAKWAAPPAIATAAAVGINKLNEKIDPSVKDTGLSGTPPGGADGGLNLPAHALDFSDGTKSAKALGDQIDKDREKYRDLHHDLTRQIKLAVDNTSVKTAQEEIRRLINLAETANSIDIRMQGARGAHNRKLLGDSYGGGGPVFDFRGSTVKAHDYNDFTRQARARAARAAGDGLR